MRDRAIYLVVGGFAITALAFAVVAGFFHSRTPTQQDKRIAIGAPISERQLIERRRANVGVVAAGGAVTQ